MVITGLTRNQLGSNPPRVRISPSPPKSLKVLAFLGFYFLTKSIEIHPPFEDNLPIEKRTIL